MKTAYPIKAIIRDKHALWYGRFPSPKIIIEVQKNSVVVSVNPKKSMKIRYRNEVAIKAV
jgi:hypothetical protein